MKMSRRLPGDPLGHASAGSSYLLDRGVSRLRNGATLRSADALFAVVALVVVISLLCVWFYPSMQDFMASNTMWNGLRQFSGEFSAKNIRSLESLPDSTEGTALVAIPYLQYNDAELSQIKRFVQGGGTLLLADDYGYGNSVLEYLGIAVRFGNKPLLDPLFCYKNQWLPRITDFSPEIKEYGITVVTLNHATALTNVVKSQAIAWSSSSSFLDTNGNESWNQGEPRGPLPVAAESQLGKGRVEIVSDPSILINAMVGRDDNYSFVRYLISHNQEQMQILVDTSHLPKVPLDVSKTGLADARQVLSSPYVLLGMVALIFGVVSRYALKKGEILGR